MKEIIVQRNEAGQRLDKLLLKYLNKANYGFLQKMLRKKNIVLNDKKADGREILKEQDSVKIWFSDETLAKFSDHSENTVAALAAAKVPSWFAEVEILYEDRDVLIANKPAGVLSQKAKDSDVSMVEWLHWHMMKEGELSEVQLQSFRPAVCNRLDRNTSGLLVCGKSLPGSQLWNERFRGHDLKKFYHCIVIGKVDTPSTLEGFLKKDEKTNKVTLYKEQVRDSVYIKTAYRPLMQGKDRTLLEVRLYTGKTHQIRSHLASIGHPIIGDLKYGDAEVNRIWKERAQVQHQLLHAYRLEVENESRETTCYIAPEPPVFQRLELDMKHIHRYTHGN